MTRLPPELAEARRVLCLVRPRPFSKARIYAQLLNQRAQRPRVAARALVVLFSLVASSSAMALGYRWVTLRQAPAVQPSARAVPVAAAAPVPRRHHESRSAGANQVTADNEQTQAAAVPSEAALQRPASVDGQRRTPALSVTPAPGKPHAVRVSPQSANPAPDSELSQQVRDYQQAVATMRSNPQLVLERLRAYRQKWQQSAIGEEVDLREIEALLTLGRRAEAINAARRFVRHYPSSARASDMQQMANDVPPGTARFD